MRGGILSTVIFVLTACGPGTPQCGPENCAGCCTTSGICAIGDGTNNGCGRDGESCKGCANANMVCDWQTRACVAP